MKKITKAQENWLKLGRMYWSIGRLKAMRSSLYNLERDFPRLNVSHLRNTLSEVLRDAERMAEKQAHPQEEE